MRWRNPDLRGVSLERLDEWARIEEQALAELERDTPRHPARPDVCLVCGRLTAYEVCDSCAADDRRRGLDVW